VEVALDPGAQRRHVAALPVVGLVGQGFGGVQAGHHIVVDPGLHGLGQHARLEAVPHDEVRVLLQGLVDGAHRVAAKAQALLVRGLQRVDQGLVAGRYRDAP
jgi:hypothetical protein